MLFHERCLLAKVDVVKSGIATIVSMVLLHQRSNQERRTNLFLAGFFEFILEVGQFPKLKDESIPGEKGKKVNY